METITKPEIWLHCPKLMAKGRWKLLASSAFGSVLTAADLIGFAGLTPELFHVYFLGHLGPSDGTVDVVIDDDSQNLLDLDRGATDLFFRIEEVPLTPAEKESVIEHCESGDYSAVSHLLPRPRRESKGAWSD